MNEGNEGEGGGVEGGCQPSKSTGLFRSKAHFMDEVYLQQSEINYQTITNE